MTHLRLFTALKIPPALTRQIADLPRKGLESPRWTDPDDLHITLRFIGDVSPEIAAEVADRMAGIRVKKFGMTVRGLDVFKKPHRAILQAPVESVRAPTNLTAEISERLQKLDFKITEQFYTPHVTIARTENLRGIYEYAKRHGKKIFAEWRADSFYLMQSAQIDDGQARYKILNEFKLS